MASSLGLRWISPTVVLLVSLGTASGFGNDPWENRDRPPEARLAIEGPRDLLRLRGVDDSHFRMLTDGAAWQEGENEILLKIMYHLRRDFEPVEVERWSLGQPDLVELAADADRYRGEVFALAGRVESVEAIRPVPEAADRIELAEYYACRFVLDERRPALVFSPRVPEAWRRGEVDKAQAGAYGIFLKLAGPDASEPLPVFVTSRVAWYPPTPLGNLGMDVGLFDDLRRRSGDDSEGAARYRLKDPRLTAESREAFYQMLAAVGRSRPGELLAQARSELRREGKHRFSVVPLFNDPIEQQGRLVVLSGTARQVIPIRVEDEDVVARFGIERYYQVALFTEDSQQNPLTFCVRELPTGMPTGEGPQFGESVTVAGFFFNTWAYRNRRSPEGSAEPEWQLSPLLIGRDLVWHPSEAPASNPLFGAIAAGLFVAALAGIWWALWQYGRSDKRFHKSTIARQFAPEPGTSLDEIGLDADDSHRA